MLKYNRMDFTGSCLVIQLAAMMFSSIGSSHTRPHIVFMVADDLGWNDVGFRNPDIKSPNLDQLSQAGIILNHSYVQPLCSPSRTAFMTGYYPFRLGMQHKTIRSNQAVCAGLDKTFLPEVLKKGGYSTHMVGKWHLGFCNWECTPTYRGFDTFFGYYSTMEDYYKKTAMMGGFDFRKNKEVYRAAAGNYSAYQYGDEVTKLIQEHDTSKPFFLYFPIQSVHDPLEVPAHYYDMYPHIKSLGRRTISGMVTALDDAFGRMVKALKDKDMFDDTIIIFTSDNGGSVRHHGNNYPLRGSKCTIWEGGTRASSFVHYPKLNKTGVHYDGLMHAVDWFPTIAEAAGLSYNDTDSDGLSHWKSITTLSSSPRDELVYNLDFSEKPTQGKAAIRVGDYKLIDGYPGAHNDWYKPETVWKGHQPNYVDWDDDVESIVPEIDWNVWKNFTGLYNLKDDPHERRNLYKLQPEVVEKLRKRLDYFISKMVPAKYPSPDPASNPKYYGGVWSPGWC